MQLEKFKIIDEIHKRLATAGNPGQPTTRPFVTLSYAQSLDGSLTLKAGQPLAISNQSAQTLTHHLRGLHDAILVGIGTVLADDPQLTVRLTAGQNPQPIILDSHLRYPLTAKTLQHPKPAWVITTPEIDKSYQLKLEAQRGRIFTVGADNQGRVNLDEALILLAQLGIRRLMVEGGGQIITSFMKARLVDQLVLTVAPMFVGGLRAINHLGLTQAIEIPHLKNVHYQSLADNLIIRGDLI